MKSFQSFDGATIAYHDDGDGPAVILLHGYGVDGLGQFGDFERIRPLLEKRRELFIETFGGSPLLPDPPAAGRAGLVARLLAEGARVILPDMRGFGASSKPTDVAAYSDSAMARDIVALIAHLHLTTIDVIGFSMGALTALRLLVLRPPQVKSAIVAGVGDYVIEGTVLRLPKHFPIPADLPKPLTHRVWAEQGAKVLDRGEIVPGNLASAHVIAARIIGADPKMLASVIRGAVAEDIPATKLNRVDVPVLVLNGTSDVANQGTAGLLKEIPSATVGACEGDHHSTPYQPTFHDAVVGFLEAQWARRGVARLSAH